MLPKDVHADLTAPNWIDASPISGEALCGPFLRGTKLLMDRDEAGIFTTHRSLVRPQPEWVVRNWTGESALSIQKLFWRSATHDTYLRNTPIRSNRMYKSFLLLVWCPASSWNKYWTTLKGHGFGRAAVCPHAPKTVANIPKRRLIHLIIGRPAPITTLRSLPLQCASSLPPPQQTHSKPIAPGFTEAA
jgi:hypothetical protein